MVARFKVGKGRGVAAVGRIARHGALGVVMALSTYYGFCILCLLLYNVVDPPTTGVQVQRRIESWSEEASYTKHYRPVSRDALSSHLRHAVVAAEDARFYGHGGIDWQAIEQAIEDNRKRGRTWRGGSTAEWLLSKERILDLYLNVIEWDRGVYGAEAAARQYYDTSATRLSRRQAAGLAACIPAPRHCTPQGMGRYTNTILRRMRQMNW